MSDEKKAEHYGDWVWSSANQLIEDIQETIQETRRSRMEVIDQNCYMAGLLDGEIDGLNRAIDIIKENVEIEIGYADDDGEGEEA